MKMQLRGSHLFLLGLLVFLTGCYAGQMYHEMIGAQEALQHIDDHTYIAYWQSLDKLLHVRMPYVSNLILIVFLINLIILFNYRNSWPYLVLVVSFLCLIAETIVTVKLQLPINAKVQALDLNHLPVSVAYLKTATNAHFLTRAILRFVSFILLIIATFKLLRTDTTLSQ